MEAGVITSCGTSGAGRSGIARETKREAFAARLPVGGWLVHLPGEPVTGGLHGAPRHYFCGSPHLKPMPD